MAEQASRRNVIGRLRVLARLAVVGAMVMCASVFTGGVAHAATFSHVTNRGTGLCLDAVNGDDGITLLLVHCFNVSNEGWSRNPVAKVTDHRSGGCMCEYWAYDLVNQGSGKCATAIVGSTTVTQATCDTSNTLQWWRDIAVTLNGGSLVHLLLNETGGCLEAPSGSVDGSPVELGTSGCGGTATKQWTY